MGFQVVDLLAKRHPLSVNKESFHSLIGEGVLFGHKIVLAKPQTFMNESGRAVQALLSWYKVPLENCLILCDDLDLEPGILRLRSKGSSAGHKGMQSIIEALGTPNFPRLRIGVGKVPKSKTVDHVLGKIKQAEKRLFEDALERAAKAVEHFLEHGFASTMNYFN